MKKSTLLFVLVIISFNTFSQKKRANKWFFGTLAGLEFATGTPTVINGGALNSPEATAVMSDTSGALLFYTDANTVYDNTHVAMPNGTGILGGNSSTQGALIVPYPDKDSLYYLFSLDEIGGMEGLRYSMVNMNLNGGNGDVMTSAKNVTLSANMTEKMTGVKDPNSKRYWILTHEWGNNTFDIFQVTASGLQPKTTQSIGMAHTTTSIQNTYGQMKFNTCGTKVGYAAGYLNTVEIFDFNTTTGVLSNPITLNMGSFPVYGFEFSPDGTKIYVSTYDPAGTLIQFDITSGVTSTIFSTAQILSTNTIYGLQLANNGKIYVNYSFDPTLGEITSPNSAGLACNFQENFIQLDPDFFGNMSTLNLPNFVQSFMAQPQFTCPAVSGGTVTAIAENNSSEETRVFPNPSADEFSVQLKGASTVSVYSTTGALIDEFVSEDKISFGKNYAKGIYLVRISDNKNLKTIRIVKE
ncbi:MAG: hypothetical protein K0S32_2430 [Bacteroidetes bacterium]|jgi:hypothetical protein|nr:hypothetical protein [Bacteroidota bacterium]